MGLMQHEQTAEHVIDLVIDAQMVRSCLTAAERDPMFTPEGYCYPNHLHLASGTIAIFKSRQRISEILRIVPGSSLVVAPTDRDIASPEMAEGLEESFGGGGYTALQRAALLQMAWDHVSSGLDGRESAFELHANGGIPIWRGRVRRTFDRYNELANAVLRHASVPMPEIDVSALRDVAIDHAGASKKRAVFGTITTLLGVAFIAQGLAGAGAGPVGLGALAVFVGVAVLGPVIARPFAHVIGAPLPRLRGMAGTLARENATRNPKRTSATASALMIGVALVAFITVFASSAKASISTSIDKVMASDWIVETQWGMGGMSPAASWMRSNSRQSRIRPVIRQRDDVVACSRRRASRPMNTRSVVARSRTIQPSPSSRSVVRSSSDQAKRLEWKSTSSSSSPASMRAMYRAVIPNGITLFAWPAAATASQTVSASSAGAQTS